MKNFLQELGVKQDSYVVQCDNQSVIHLAKNSTYHLKSKHIDMRYYWIREVLEKKQLLLKNTQQRMNQI